MRIVQTLAFATLLIVVSSPVAARSRTYNDQHDADYLRVASRFVQPVGTALEWLLFRPLEGLTSWTDPDPQAYSTRFPNLDCDGPRPQRGCSARGRRSGIR